MNLITAQELKELLEMHPEAVILDCRSLEAFNAQHIVGARSLPWKEIPERAQAELPDKDTLIITSCSSLTCDASEKCYTQLEQLGYTNLREFSGGLAEWLANNYSTESEQN